MSFLYLYKPHCFFDLGLAVSNEAALKKLKGEFSPVPETVLPVITKGREPLASSRTAGVNEDDDIEILLLF